MKVSTFYENFSKELNNRLVVINRWDEVLFQAWVEGGEVRYYGSYADVKDLDVYALTWGHHVWLTVK